ncbi:porin [Corynebacterium sp.]|nr:porin [Corynebacterium sp.]MDO5032281.1 porin [Corynebacterium sp.]
MATLSSSGIIGTLLNIFYALGDMAGGAADLIGLL